MDDETMQAFSILFTAMVIQLIVTVIILIFTIRTERRVGRQGLKFAVLCLLPPRLDIHPREAHNPDNKLGYDPGWMYRIQWKEFINFDKALRMCKIINIGSIGLTLVFLILLSLCVEYQWTSLLAIALTFALLFTWNAVFLLTFISYTAPMTQMYNTKNNNDDIKKFRRKVNRARLRKGYNMPGLNIYLNEDDCFLDHEYHSPTRAVYIVCRQCKDFAGYGHVTREKRVGICKGCVESEPRYATRLDTKTDGEVDATNEALACITCLTNKKNVLLETCGHIVTCAECSNKQLDVKQYDCPMCRKTCYADKRRVVYIC